MTDFQQYGKEPKGFSKQELELEELRTEIINLPNDQRIKVEDNIRAIEKILTDDAINSFIAFAYVYCKCKIALLKGVFNDQ